MKKKEILTIFVLVVLLTGLSWFYVSIPFALDALITKRGWPLAYWSHTIGGFDFGLGRSLSFPPRWNYLSVAVDFFFWFLVLAGGWWVVKKLGRDKSSGGG